MKITSDRIIRIAAKIGYDHKISRRDIIAYILNKFISRDTTNMSNEHMIKYLYANAQTVKNIIKTLQNIGLITKTTKVFEDGGVFKTYRILTINKDLLNKMCDDDLTALTINPSKSSMVITKGDDYDVRRGDTGSEGTTADSTIRTEERTDGENTEDVTKEESNTSNHKSTEQSIESIHNGIGQIRNSSSQYSGGTTRDETNSISEEDLNKIKQELEENGLGELCDIL